MSAMMQAMSSAGRRRSRLLLPALTALLGLWLSGCAGPKGAVPVDDRGRGGSQAMRGASPVSGSYQVQRGDTLYQIAFRYGMDWRDLASANRISAPYTIYPGQTLRVSTGTAAPVVASARTTSPRPAVAGRSRPAAAPSGQGATQTSRTPAAVVEPVTPPAPVSASAPAPAVAPPVAAPASSERSAVVVKGWTWPAQGPLIARFNSNGSLNKGIDIAGNLGQPVRAAADGSVVYAGQGLLGYGEMLIIKHDDVYLSAYAHNSRLRVKEGDRVKAGDVIAEMGSSGTDRVKLHFEIRRRGQPVDPLTYLPRQ